MNHDGKSDPTGLTSLLEVRAARWSALLGLSASEDVSLYFSGGIRWNAFKFTAFSQNSGRVSGLKVLPYYYSYCKLVLVFAQWLRACSATFVFSWRSCYYRLPHHGIHHHQLLTT